MNTVIIPGFPMPPSVNRALGNRRGPGRGRYKTAAYLAFERDVLLWAALSHRTLGQARDLVSEPRQGAWLHLESRFHFPLAKLITKAGRPKRLDADNRIKLSTDALVKLLRIDDCLIGAGTYRKVIVPQGSFIDFVVTWTPIEQRC